MGFDTEKAKQAGAKPKIEIKIWDGVEYAQLDISPYLKKVPSITQELERGKYTFISGDVRIALFNTVKEFSPEYASSLIYEKYLLNRDIQIGLYFEQADGSPTAVERIFTGRMKARKWDSKQAQIDIRCMDILKKALKEKICAPKHDEVAVADPGNTGTGTFSKITKKGLATVTETWTVVFTDATHFTATGSVSGLQVNTGTVGTEYSSDSEEVTFTISQDGGDTAFIATDQFTFKTYQLLEWTDTNPADIIKDILTDTTQGLGLTEGTYIDAAEFASSKAKTADIELTGSFDNKIAKDAIAEIMQTCLGKLTVSRTGKIKFIVWEPEFAATYREFTDTVDFLDGPKPEDKVDDIINSIGIKWGENLENLYVCIDSNSVSNYKTTIYEDYEMNFVRDENTAKNVGDKMLYMFATPPETTEVVTNLQAVDLELAEHIKLTDTLMAWDGRPFMVRKLKKQLAAGKVTVVGEHAQYLNENWAFLGSNAVEADHDWTPASSQDWDTATAWERQFCYMSQDGAGADPRYYMW